MVGRKLRSSEVISNTLRVVIWLRSDQCFVERKLNLYLKITTDERKILHVFLCGFILVYGY